jgi:hypothetical protein
MSQYQELRGDDRIKDFITESPENFEKTCLRLAAAMNLSVTDYTALAEGCQITAGGAQYGSMEKYQKIPEIHAYTACTGRDRPPQCSRVP